MFVRFVAGTDGKNAYWLTGVFVIARELRDANQLQDYEVERLDDIFDWFNDHLPCPPFEKNLKSRIWSRDAVSWFRDDAKEPVKRMWEIVALLHEHGVAVRFVQTERPGKIVYEDQFQVVAETVNCADEL